MRRWALLLCLVGCGTDDDLEWVTPEADDTAPIGDAVELAVASTDATVVHFGVNGVEIAACDPALPDEDCKRDDIWRWTTTFAEPGTYELSAWTDSTEITRTITVVRELPLSAFADVDLSPVESDEPDDLPPLEAAGRGLLDPDRPFHNIYGGIR